MMRFTLLGRGTLLGALAVLFLVRPLAAQTTYTWDAGGTNNTSWGNATNWVGDVVPAFNTNAILVFDTNVETADTLFLGAQRQIRGLAFGANLTGGADNVFDIQTRTSLGGGGTNLLFNGGATNASITLDDNTAGLTRVRLGSGNVGTISLQTTTDVFHNASGVVLQFDANTTGAGALNKHGVGAVTFTRANSFNGLNLYGGTVVAWNSATALGNNSVTLGETGSSSNASLFLGNTLTYTNNITVSSGSGTRLIGNTDVTNQLAGFGAITGNATLSGAINLAAGKDATFAINNITSNGTLSTDRMTVSGAITGTGGVIKTGSGFLLLSGANTYSGDTVLEGGNIQTAASNSFSSASVLKFGATTNSRRLQLQGRSQTVGGVDSTAATGGTLTVEAAADNVSNSPATLTLDVAAGRSYDFSGYVRNAAGTATNSALTLVKNGAGTQVFSGSSGWVNYSGTTTINGGVLEFSGANSTGDNSAMVLGGGTVRFSGGGTRSNTISGTGNLEKTGTNTLILSGNNTFSGGTLVSAGTLQFNDGGWVAGNITNNAALLFNSTDSATVATVISGAGALIKAGAGTLTLDGENTYTGSTTINAGTLVLGASGSMRFVVGPSGQSTVVAGAGALVAEGTFELDLTAAATSGSWQLVSAAAVTYGPSFSVAGFTESPAGTWTLDTNGVTYRFVESTGVLSIPAQVTTAVADGNWSEAGTWDRGVPAAGDEVVIPEGTTVTINGDFTCGKIKVHGKLQVARADTSLTCDSIMVMGSGSVFEIGSPSQRFTHKFTLTLKGLASSGTGSMGAKFIGAHNGGRLEFHGEERVSWTRLGASAAAGASSITVLEPVDWRPGEEILVTSTSTDWNQAEKRVVESVTPDGLTVNLASPLTHFHSGETRTHTRPSDGKTWSIDLRAEVGLLSRNVRIQGDAQSEVSGFGGHIMVMNKDGCCETPGVGNIQGVELYRMGQKGMLGRYPFHWHMLLNHGRGQYFRNNSVHRSFNRAITVHGTESTLVEDNFCYDHIGHGLFLEDGSERFNTIRRNVVVLSKRPAPGEEVTPSDNELNNFQNRTPSSYWITNPNNIFEDNVAAGTEGTGFWFAFPTSPMGDSAVEPYFAGLEPHTEPLGKFDRNTAHSCMNGLDINDQLNPDHSLIINGAWENDGPFFFNDCVWYSNNVGVYAGIGQRRQNVVYYNNTFADNQIAVFLATYQLVEESLLIADSGLGHFTGRPTMYMVYDGAGRMKNNHMVGWHHPDSRLLSNIGAAIKHPNHRFEGFTWDQPGPPTNILPNYDFVPPPNIDANGAAHPRVWAQVILDIDGSITGTPNSSIIANNRFMVTGQEHQPANWANNLVSPHRFAQMRASYNLDSDFHPNVSIVRQKAGTPSAGVYYINGFKERHQLPFIVNEDFVYTYYYESLPSSNRINFTFDDAEIGDTVTVRIKEFGRHANLTVSRMVSHSSLSSLMSAAESGYYAEPDGDLYLRPVATQNYDNGAYVVRWSGDIALPVWDSDGDGISDATEAATGNNAFDFPPVPAESYEQWADRFGLAGTDRDENANPDGDGFSNFEEYIAGTDPTDPGSHVMASAEMTGQGMALTFNTIEGRNYQVMRSVDLVGWEPLGSPIPGDGMTVEMIDTDPPEPRAFYRVLISLP